MGEVYRARDTRLSRDVAVKVLPQHLSSNPEVRARFEREAKTVSSLNHPHICTLHDVGREGETDYLVMELVEGETLAQRLTKGPLATAEILKLGARSHSPPKDDRRDISVHGARAARGEGSRRTQ
jgi:serine/threonine protein kinase